MARCVLATTQQIEGKSSRFQRLEWLLRKNEREALFRFAASINDRAGTPEENEPGLETAILFAMSVCFEGELCSLRKASGKEGRA
jgi:hypothetical protein